MSGGRLHEGVALCVDMDNRTPSCWPRCPRETIVVKDFGREGVCSVCRGVWSMFAYEIGRPPIRADEGGVKEGWPIKVESPPVLIEHIAMHNKPYESWSRYLDQRLEEVREESRRAAAEKAARPDPYVVHRATIPAHVEQWVEPRRK